MMDRCKCGRIRIRYQEGCGVCDIPVNIKLPPEKTEPWKLPAPEDREDGLEVLAFHRGKWRHVRWVVDHQRWSLGYGGPFFIEADRPFAPLPAEKTNGWATFYTYKEKF